MDGKNVEFMKLVNDYCLEKHPQLFAGDAGEKPTFDAEALDFSGPKVTLKNWAMKITKRHINDDSARGLQKKIDMEERVTIKIDMDRSFVFRSFDITAAELLFVKLPDEFKATAQPMFQHMRGSFTFPIAGCEEYIYTRKVSVKAGVVDLHETQYEIPLMVKTTFRGHVMVGQQQIHMHDVIKSMWSKLRRAVPAVDAAAREASVDQFCEDGTFVSLGTCTLTMRYIK